MSTDRGYVVGVMVMQGYEYRPGLVVGLVVGIAVGIVVEIRCW